MYPSIATHKLKKGETMGKFKKCPRCELNYIPVEEEYCALCKEELKGILVDEPEEQDEEEGLCPRCRTNYVNDGEKYCEQCLHELENEKEKGSHDDIWEEDADDNMSDEELLIDNDFDLLDDNDLASLGELADEEFETDYDEEDEEVDHFEEDDFETVSPDDYDEDEDDEEEDIDED